MQRNPSASLATIFSETLANLAFMFSDEESQEGASGEVWLETVISYRGPACGTLRFRCPHGFSRLLAANLLGVDANNDDADANAVDAVKEFMNIVCGQYVTATHGLDDVFNLTIPEISELPERPDLSEDRCGQKAALSVEGYRLQLAHLAG